MFHMRDESAMKIHDQMVGINDEVSLGRVTSQMYQDIYNKEKTTVADRVKYIDQDITNMIMRNDPNNNT